MRLRRRSPSSIPLSAGRSGRVRSRRCSWRARHRLAAGATAGRVRGPLGTVLQDAQEIGVGRKHQRRAGIGERLTVSLQRAIELVELRILVEGVGEQAVGLGVAFAAADGRRRAALPRAGRCARGRRAPGFAAPIRSPARAAPWLRADARTSCGRRSPGWFRTAGRRDGSALRRFRRRAAAPWPPLRS